MIIKFKYNEYGQGITPCPHEKVISKAAIYPIMVGTYNCYDCHHRIKVDNTTNELTCIKELNSDPINILEMI